MQPRRIFDELFQKDRGGAGAAVASAGVHQVSDLERIWSGYSWSSGRRQNFSPDRCSARVKCWYASSSLAKDAGVGVAKGHNAGSGERGGVNQVRAAESRA